MHPTRLLILASLAAAALARPAAAETITGTFRYTKAPGDNRPIANAEVDILRFHPALGPNFVLVGSATTDSNGLLSTQSFGIPASMYRVRVRMRNPAAGIYTAPWPVSDVTFVEPGPAGIPLTFAAGAPNEVLNFSFTFADAFSVGGFNIIDTIAVGERYASARRDPMETDTIGQVRVELQSISPVAFYEPVTSTMRLRTGQELLDGVTLHEYGHFLEQRISSVAGFGGSHTLCTASFPAATQDFGFAWTEGFADYFAEVVALANPGVLSGGFSNLETPSCPPSPSPRDSVELFVSAALFDIADNNQDGGDAYCNASMIAGDVRVFQIFDRELDNQGFNTPTLQMFFNAWAGRGWDVPMLQATFATHGIAMATPPPTVLYDFSAAANLAVYRSVQALFIIDGGMAGLGLLGANGDVPVPADYDGDGLTDIATWRPADGVWRVLHSSGGGTENQQWGQPGDIPLPADYDGDNETDFAIYRPMDGHVYLFNDGCGGWELTNVGFGAPVVGDYDGDLRDDPGIFDSASWFRIQLRAGGSVTREVAGGGTPFALDFDGNGIADFSTFADGVWRTALGVRSKIRLSWLGTRGDVPVPADYDGNGTADLAAFTPSSGMWLRMIGGIVTSTQFGQLGDVPVPAR